MKKKLKIILSLLLIILFNNSIFSQGGNTPAAASGAPITLPFNTISTTCGKVNNYNPLSPYAIPTSGEDWLYYFCAPTSGVIDLFMSNDYGVIPGIFVYSAAPNATGSNWTSTSFTGGNYMNSLVTLTVTAGSCYYVMIDNDPFDNDWGDACFAYNLTIQYHVPPPAAPLQPACSNIGYDNGSLSGWIGTTGVVQQGAVSDPTPIYTPLYYTTSATQHVVTSGAGVDPIGGFPVVNPGTGPNSLRLGDLGNFGTPGNQIFGGVPGNGGATLEQKFTVTASNALFVYYYAVVIQDAGTDHTNPEQPFFKTDVFDCSGNPVACGQYLVTGGPGIPGFISAGNNMYYKNWSPVAVDLTPYIGTCVTVRYTVGDCTRGAHFAYAYIDATCNPLTITGANQVCPTQSATLTAPVGLFTYSWTPGGATTQTVAVTPTTTTTYTCELTSYTNCQTFLTYSVSLFPSAIASINSATVCNGTSALLTSTVNNGVGTYTWSPGPGSGPTLSPSPTSTTIYTLTYSDGNGCQDTAMGRVTVNPIPTMVTPTNVVICNNGVVSASAFSSTVVGTTYNWTNSNTAIGLSANGTVNTPSFTAINLGANSVNAVISVTPTSNSCVGPPVTYTIIVNPIPKVNAVASATYCSGAAVPATNFTGSVTSTTYSWSNTNSAIGLGTLGTGNINSYGATNTSVSEISGVITVTPSANTCVGLPTNFTIAVNPIPTVNAVPSITVCSGATVTAVNFNGAVTGTNYNWTNTNSSIGLGTSGLGNIASFTSANSSGSAVIGVVTVTPSANSCVGTSINYSITVNPNPVAPTVSNQTVCPTSSATLTATAPGGTYNWFDNNVSGILLSTNSSYTTPALTITTTYYVNTTNVFGCVSPFTTVVANVLNSLTVDASPNQTICIGASASLSVNPTTAGNTYSWDAAGNIAFSNISNPIVNPTVTTTYSVSVTNVQGCTGNNQTQVFVNPLPIAYAGNPIAFCDGQSGILGSASIAGYTYSWMQTTGLNSSTASSPTVTLSNLGITPSVSNYTLTVTLNGCQASNQVQVTVNPLPQSIAGNPITLCAGQTGTIGTISNPDYTYSWLPTLNLNSTTSANPSVNGVNVGASSTNVTYTVTTTENSTSCQSNAQVLVTTLPPPNVNAGSGAGVCEGVNNIQLNGTTGGSVNSVIWSGGGGSFIANNTLLNPSYNPSLSDYANSSITLTLTAIAIAPCQNVSSTVQIDFYKNPVINFSVINPKGCPEHCVDFTDQSAIPLPDAIQSWAWNFGDGNSSTAQNPNHCYNQSGLYSVTLTATTNHQCSSILSIPDMVEVYQTPIASFYPAPSEGSIIDPNITFQNTSQGATTFIWGFGDEFAIGTNNSSTEVNPQHAYTNSGEYVVTLIATSINGCEDRVAIPVEIKPEFTFYIPNTFTPNNNDGINDIFTGMGIGIEKYEMWIFDRWGEKIFYTQDIKRGWDGTRMGKTDVVQQDVYVWKVKLKDVFAKSHEYIGHVTLLK